MIESCDRLIDVGCDHGFISIGAVQSGKARTAIASDIRKEPLLSAKANIEKAGLSESINASLSDGLKNITFSADTIVITGMGGNTIMDILENAYQDIQNGLFSPLSDAKQLILGPQSELPEFRHYILDKTDFYILSENIVFDDGKYYSLMDIRRKDQSGNIDLTYNDYEYEFGISLKGDYIDYLKNICSRLSSSINSANQGNSSNALSQTLLLKKRFMMLNEYMSVLKIK